MGNPTVCEQQNTNKEDGVRESSSSKPAVMRALETSVLSYTSGQTNVLTNLVILFHSDADE